MRLRDRFEVQRILRGAVRHRARTTEALVDYSEQVTGKQITVRALPGLSSVSGAVSDSGRDATIYYSRDGGEWRQRIVIAHELAHLLLRHTCERANSPRIRDILQLFPGLPESMVIQALERAGFKDEPDTESSNYDSPEEQAAETLASKLLVLTLASDDDFNTLSAYQRWVSNSSIVTTFMGTR